MTSILPDATEFTQTRIIVFVAIIGTDALLLVFAYLIGVRQMTGLISGHKRVTAHDEAGLARFMAIRQCSLAAVYLLLCIVFLLISSSTGFFICTVGFLAATLIGAIAMESGKNRYLTPPERP